MIVQSPSGTGKTVTFGLITLLQFCPEIKNNQIIVFEPTTELARQTYEEYKKMCKHLDVSFKQAYVLTREEQKKLIGKNEYF